MQKEDKKKDNKIEVGELELDLDKFEVKVRGEIIDLTLREFEVLKFLASQPEQVVTRETLLEKVWGYEYYGDIRTVDVTVRRIREKIEKDTSAPKILITKRGVGYYIASKQENVAKGRVLFATFCCIRKEIKNGANKNKKSYGWKCTNRGTK